SATGTCRSATTLPPSNSSAPRSRRCCGANCHTVSAKMSGGRHEPRPERRRRQRQPERAIQDHGARRPRHVPAQRVRADRTPSDRRLPARAELHRSHRARGRLARGRTADSAGRGSRPDRRGDTGVPRLVLRNVQALLRPGRAVRPRQQIRHPGGHRGKRSARARHRARAPAAFRLLPGRDRAGRLLRQRRRLRRHPGPERRGVQPRRNGPERHPAAAEGAGRSRRSRRSLIAEAAVSPPHPAHQIQKAGVPRWIPSDFSLAMDRLDYGDNEVVDLRKKAGDLTRGSTVASTPILIGAFLEVLNMPWYKWIDWESGVFSYWGDGDQPVDFTTYGDTAEWTAEVALDPSTAGRTVRV